VPLHDPGREPLQPTGGHPLADGTAQEFLELGAGVGQPAGGHVVADHGGGQLVDQQFPLGLGRRLVTDIEHHGFANAAVVRSGDHEVAYPPHSPVGPHQPVGLVQHLVRLDRALVPRNDPVAVVGVDHLEPQPGLCPQPIDRHPEHVGDLLADEREPLLPCIPEDRRRRDVPDQRLEVTRRQRATSDPPESPAARMIPDSP
jgi:hypothetical protein